MCVIFSVGAGDTVPSAQRFVCTMSPRRMLSEKGEPLPAGSRGVARQHGSSRRNDTDGREPDERSRGCRRVRARCTLGAFLPRDEVAGLLLGELIDRDPHRLELQTGDLAVDIFGQRVNAVG